VIPVVPSGSPKLTDLPLRSLSDLTSFDATISTVSGASGATSGTRLPQSGWYLTLTSSESTVTMAKSAMSVRMTFSTPVGAVEPTIARPCAP
jgi:hypothetical protein